MSAAVPQGAADAREPRESVSASAASKASEASTYEEVNDRLKQIVGAIDDDMPLDHALDLLEEAVGLGMKASELIERDVEESGGAQDGDAEAPQASGSAPDADDADTTSTDGTSTGPDAGKAV